MNLELLIFVNKFLQHVGIYVVHSSYADSSYFTPYVGKVLWYTEIQCFTSLLLPTHEVTEE
jgi:hypothetical protein